MKAVWIKDGIVINISGWDNNSSRDFPGYLIIIVPEDSFVSKGFIVKEELNEKNELFYFFEEPVI